MTITISTDTHYTESTRKGVGHEVKVSAKTAAKWRKVLREYEEIQREISEGYNLACKEFFRDFDFAGAGQKVNE
jgi:CTP-dependent riboflavin kinase